MADHRDRPADETRTTGDPVHRDDTRTTGAPVHHEEAVVHEDRREVVGREREEHGGVKIGSAFFGWLTATGMAVLLTALAAAAGTAVSVATGNESASEATDAVGATAETVGLAGCEDRNDRLAVNQDVALGAPRRRDDRPVGDQCACHRVLLSA